jgi:hypothetical protein
MAGVNNNLIPIEKGQLTKEESRQRASNGGKKSVEVRRKKKRFRELFNSVLDQKNEKTGERHDMAIVKAMINKASAGNVKAFEAIRDTTGEFVGALDIDNEDITSEQLENMGLEEMSNLFIKKVLKNVLLNPTKESIEETLKILSLAKNNKKE